MTLETAITKLSHHTGLFSSCSGPFSYIKLSSSAGESQFFKLTWIESP